MTAKVLRRSFLKTASTAAAVSVLPRRVWGANDRIGVAQIGLNGIGNMHLGQLAAMGEVDVVAACDVDRNVLDKRVASMEKKPELFSDFRKVLEMKEVDAVVVAVPDHWHAYITTQAFEAGKDVYVEKPLGHNIREGRLIVESAKKHGRVMQNGLQQRSGPHWQEAVEKIKTGDLGKVHMVRVFNAWSATEMRGDMGKPPDAPTPEGVDYDMWLGAAPKQPFNPAHFHEYWYFFWNYSGGMISAWGVHLFDIVMWAMGPEISSVRTVGGDYVLDDLRDTPDTSETVFECPDYTLSYMVRHANGWRPFGDMDHGIEFIGTDGVLQIDRAGYEIFREGDRSSRTPSYTQPRHGEDHYLLHKRNFLECMRTREQTAANPEVGHTGAIPGHLANISYRLGREILWDSKNETFEGDEEAKKLLTREYREPWVL